MNHDHFAHHIHRITYNLLSCELAGQWALASFRRPNYIHSLDLKDMTYDLPSPDHENPYISLHLNFYLHVILDHALIMHQSASCNMAITLTFSSDERSSKQSKKPVLQAEFYPCLEPSSLRLSKPKEKRKRKRKK